MAKRIMQLVKNTSMISNQVCQKKRHRKNLRKLELQLWIYQELYKNKRPMKYKINIIK